MDQLIQAFESSFDGSWLPDDMLARYSPIECLAENSGCTTLMLENKETGERCIAKCYNKDNVRLSVTENEILSIISHKGLPKYMGQYENDKTVCVLREYIKGKPLDRIISQQRFSPDEISSFALKICDILDYLHNLPTPVLHRDIKPENIIIDDNSDVYLIDFGISRIVRDLEKKDTKIAATAAYAPPEQFGFLPTDARSDLYALGVVMNEMLTGSAELNENIPDGNIGRIIKKCTAFSPKDRYSSAKQLSRDILCRKYRTLIIAAGIISALLAAAVLLFGIFSCTRSEDNIAASPSDGIIMIEASSSDATDSSNINFRLDTTSGVMTVSGSGRITEDALPSSELVDPRSVRELVFEEGITEIGKFSADNYTNLKKVTLPASAVGFIDREIFNGSVKLDILSVQPEYDSGIGWSYNFRTKTLEVTYCGEGSGIVDGEKYWHKIACVDFYSIEHAIIGEGVTELGFNTFWIHTSLKSIELPSTVRKIDSSNFADTPSLEKITVHPDNDVFYTVDGALYGYTLNKDGERRIYHDILTDFDVLPRMSEFVPDVNHPSGHFNTHIDDNGIKREGHIADEDGTFTNDVTLDCKNIGKDGEESLVYSIEYPRYQRKLYFVPRNASGTYSVLPGSDIIGAFSFADCSSVEKIIISHNVALVEDSAFVSLKSIRDFDITNSTTYLFDEENKVLYSIGEKTDDNGDVFRTMNIITALPNISGHYVIPDTRALVYINDNAFFGCTALTEVTIPLNVETIGAEAFRNCTSLEKVNLPEDVTSISARYTNKGWGYLGYAAFENTAITSFDIPYGTRAIPDFCFSECRNLKSINIPDTVTSIDYKAFRNCSSLESVAIPDTVTKPFGTSDDDLELFSGCTSLKTVTLPENMDFHTIGKRFFAGCTSLETIKIPENIKTIEEEAFMGSGLTEIDTYTVRVIKDNAFKNCTSLTYAKLPNVEKIHDGAFANCSSLESVELSEKAPDVSESAFSGCGKLS